MAELIEQIKKIREINKQHKLVIFVGAGVSRNSGVCSWWELIKDIASKIGYNDICDNCEMKNLICSECGKDLELCTINNYNCQYKYNYSSDDFLKIPQFFYEEKGEEEYIRFLKEKFCQKYEPNAIDELIIDLEPEHIITTNYDHLIEDVKSPNISDYTVIKNDNDLLEKYGLKYIIKMHGDIDDIKNIVLKEDDYLNYSQNHELIEMYIKSILIDKTFLFIGYSLNDNNLKLIMSYINYFAKDLNIKRSPHYLVTNQVVNEERNVKYWDNKGVELVDLSMITELMTENAPCDLNEYGKSLYIFLKYIKNDKLPYSKDVLSELKSSLLKNLALVEPFYRISYTSLLSICNFSSGVDLQNGSLIIFDKSEYDKLYSILSDKNSNSNKIKKYFIKSGIYSICNFNSSPNPLSYGFATSEEITDELFILSMMWAFSEIIDKLSDMDVTLEKAYYYSLIYKNIDNRSLDILSSIESEINKKDFKKLSLKDKYIIAILEYDLIAIRLLNFNVNNEEKWDKLNRLLDSASIQSEAFEYIKKLCGNNGEIINKLNNLLIKHEEYYMRKSTMTKLGGTIYGDIFKLQAIVYDYYYFYKKNFLMLDWFNDVSQMCEPYIKAVLCTYYPDEYQYSNSGLVRTQVEPYPLNLIDIDMILRHVKFKEFNSWLSYYKVFNLTLVEDLDITEIFNNFCISVRSFWLTDYTEHINLFGKLLSLVELTNEESHKVLTSFMHLVTPDEYIGIRMLRNCLKALWLFIEKHYDEKDHTYCQLLNLLLDETILTNLLNMKSDYQNLMHTLSSQADKTTYKKCCDLIDNCNSESERVHYSYIFKDILLIFEEDEWKKWIKDNMSNNYVEEVFDYLKNDIVTFDESISNYFETKITSIQNTPGMIVFPDQKSEIITILVLLLLIGKIPDFENLSFLKKYCNEFDYLDFLFNPETFDYSKINIADYMWCNFINSDKYRDIILKHKSDFWSKKDEKRIELGFGGPFENQIAYKYLFD